MLNRKSKVTCNTSERELNRSKVSMRSSRNGLAEKRDEGLLEALAALQNDVLFFDRVLFALAGRNRFARQLALQLAPSIVGYVAHDEECFDRIASAMKARRDTIVARVIPEMLAAISAMEALRKRGAA